MFIVKTAPSPSDESLARVIVLPDQSARTAVSLARRRRPAGLASVERWSAPFRPAVGGRSPSEDGGRGEREAA
jgi:hypothetical protein